MGPLERLVPDIAHVLVIESRSRDLAVTLPVLTVQARHILSKEGEELRKRVRQDPCLHVLVKSLNRGLVTCDDLIAGRCDQDERLSQSRHTPPAIPHRPPDVSVQIPVAESAGQPLNPCK